MLPEQSLYGPEKAIEPISRRIIRQIEAYISGAELYSSRLQVFADITDIQRARIPRAEDGKYNRRLIEETVRQRQNSVPGYKREYDDIHMLITTYRDALGRRFAEPTYIDNIVSLNLTEIKTQHIYKAGQQLHTRQR